MSLLTPISEFDVIGVKWAKLQRWLRLAIDNAGISYSLEYPLTDIQQSDVEGVKWAKLGAWMELLANNISGGGGGGPAAAGTLTGTTLAANVVNSSLTSFGAGIGVLKTATVTLTDAQIKALPTTPITIVAAAGAGKAIVPLGTMLDLNTAAGGYTIDHNASWQLSFQGTNNYVSGLIVPWQAMEQDGRSFLRFPSGLMENGAGDFAGYSYSQAINLSGLGANLPLVMLDDFNGVANYTGGNAANSMKVTVWYVEVDV